MDKLKKTYECLLQASRPEEIFGPLDRWDNGSEEKLEANYLELFRVVNPNLYIDDPARMAMAQDSFKTLSEFYEQAKKYLKGRDYEHVPVEESREDYSRGLLIKTIKRDYLLQKAIAEGDIATIYRGVVSGADESEAPIVIKIVNDLSDNDLAMNEIKVLKIFRESDGRQTKHLPVFLDSFRTSENKQAAIMRYFKGYDIYSIREKYPEGIDPRHIAWIMARALSVLGYVHSLGIIHGNIDPTHILVRPRDHNILLVGWGCACVNPLLSGDGFKVYNKPYSAPEVAEKKPPLPSSDLYSLAKSMIYLIGGDPETNFIPPAVPEEFACFLKALVLESPLQRPRDAWETYRFLGELRVKVWGEIKFLDLEM